MKLGNAVHESLPWVRALHDIDGAWQLPTDRRQVDAVTDVGRALGAELRAGPKVAGVRTLDLTTLVYPTKYAFAGACLLPLPFVTLTHRSLLVQFRAGGKLRNLLFNPTHYPASNAAPYFRKLITKLGEGLAQRVPKQQPTVDKQLARFGLTPADIDLIAFDHFHVQDLRPLLGTVDKEGRSTPAMYPNARLLAPRSEWESWTQLHPMQAAWYVHDGRRDVRDTHVVLTDGDLALGDGVLLLRTPGHTTGNQTLFCHGDRGVFGCSENGCCIDNWSPHASRIPGLASMSELQGLDVVLNANTPELGCVQYASMMLERSVVDPLPEDTRFVQMFSSSEVTPSWLAPGIRPTHQLYERDSGSVTTGASPMAHTADAHAQ